MPHSVLPCAPFNKCVSLSNCSLSLVANSLNLLSCLSYSPQAERLVKCAYDYASGTFALEGLWQTGNTLESLAAAIDLLPRVGVPAAPGRSTQWNDVLLNSFAKLPTIIGDCFDDHQWCVS